jgi:nicotinamide mononucleotide transporter
MTEFTNNLMAGIWATSALEWLSVITGILYVIFAARQMIICWLFALISSGLFFFLCFTNQLYIESVLQLFYVVMAVVGWFMWNKKPGVDYSDAEIIDSERIGNEGSIIKWSLKSHILNIAISAVLAIVLGMFFSDYTNQANPFIDAFTTVFSLAATFMVTQKVLENWLYWIVIDLVSIYLYAGRDLYLSATLYFVFTIIAIVGFAAWQKQYKQQNA